MQLFVSMQMIIYPIFESRQHNWHYIQHKEFHIQPKISDIQRF